MDTSELGQPASPRLHVDVSEAVEGAASADAICAAYAKRLSESAEVQSVAIWRRIGRSNDAYGLVWAQPETATAAKLADTHPISEWANASVPFAWRVSDGYGTLLPRANSTDAVELLFAQERALILALNVSSADVAYSNDIRCVQSGLAQLTVHLVAHGSVAELWNYSNDSDDPITIDCGFLEATAMGDTDFMRYMLDLCVQELHLGRARLRAGLVAEDVDNLVFVAHKLRSTARTAGAERLDGFLEHIERTGKSGRISGVGSAIAGIEATIAAISDVLASF